MILDIYKSVLKYCGLGVDNDGYVFIAMDKDKTRLRLDGKHVVLPTEQHLRNYDASNILFHPLSENILEKTESPIIKKLKNIINIRLNQVAGVLAQNLLNILVSPELHKRLNSDQSDILTISSDVDSKMLDFFITYTITNMKKKSSKLFTDVYIKRSGNYQSKKVSRLAVVSFPFYEEIDTLKCRKKDKVIYKALFEFMFPDIDEVDGYNYGSHSRVAPTLDALLLGSLTVASKLNDLVIQYKDFIDDADMLEFDGEWVDAFNDLEVLVGEIRKIPKQVIEPTQPTPDSNQLTMTDLYQGQAQPNQPVQQMQAMQPNQPIPQQPGMQPNQPMPQQPVNEYNPDGTLDFNSIKVQNPNLTYGYNPTQGLVPQPINQPYPTYQPPQQPQWVDPRMQQQHGFYTGTDGQAYPSFLY